MPSTGSNPHRTTSSSAAFTALRPGVSLSALHHLEGFIVSSSAYSSATRLASFDLASVLPTEVGMRIQVQLKGEWAEEASEKLVKAAKTGRSVILDGKGGIVGLRWPKKSGKGKGEVPEGERLRVVFEKGVRGAWRNEEGRKIDVFVFKPSFSTTSSKKSATKSFIVAASSSSPSVSTATTTDIIPSTALSTTTNTYTSAAPPPPSFSASHSLSNAPRKLDVPRANPSNPYVHTSGGPAKSLEFDYAVEVEDEADARSEEGAAISSPTQRTQESREMKEVRGTPKEEHPEEEEEDVKVGAVKRRREPEEGEAGQPGRKKQRKERVERTSWGLTANTRQYLRLDGIPDKNASGLHVIALVVAKSEPRQARNGAGDWNNNFNLYDPTKYDEGTSAGFFATTEQELPKPQDGDIMIIQQLNWTKAKQTFTAYPNKGNFLILPFSQLVSETPSPLSSFARHPTRGATDLTDDELSYARDLAKWAKKHDLLGNLTGDYASKTTETVRERVAPRRSLGRPTVTVSEMVEDKFCDVYGEIVKYVNHSGGSHDYVRTPHSNDQCTLYLTDYTHHPDLYEYPSSEMKPGDRRVIQVSIFGNQNEPLLGVRPEKLQGKIVGLRNVRPKMGSTDYLEATMVEDYKYKDRRDVTLIQGGSKANQLSCPPGWKEAFMARRNAYWSTGEVPTGLAPVFGAAGAVEEEKQLRDPLSEITDLSTVSAPEPQSISGALALNSPGTYRFRVRVADFNPPRLDDWVKAFCSSCQRDLSTGEDSCLTCDDVKEVEYEWDFLLALAAADEKDTDSQIIVRVGGEEADALIPSFSPSSFASIRSGSSLDPLHSRLRGILGSHLESLKRHRKPDATRAQYGPAFEVVLEGFRVEGREKLCWRFKEGKVVFRSGGEK